MGNRPIVTKLMGLSAFVNVCLEWYSQTVLGEARKEESEPGR